MVYVDGKSAPNKKHETKESATAEAERLARMQDNNSRDVFVLETIASCKTDFPPVKWE